MEADFRGLKLCLRYYCNDDDVKYGARKAMSSRWVYRLKSNRLCYVVKAKSASAKGIKSI